MKVIYFYCGENKKLKYTKIGLKLSLFLLIALHNPATAAFKAGSVYNLVGGFYNAIP